MMRAPVRFLWIWGWLFFPHLLSAATIVKLSEKKHVVLLDAGEIDGFVKGKTVCFFDEAQQPLSCGKIVKHKETQSYVRVDKSDIQKLQKGFFAHLQADGVVADHRWGITGAYTPWFVTPFSVAVPNYVAPGVGVNHVDSLWTPKETESSSFTALTAELYVTPWHMRGGFRYMPLQIVPQLEANYDNADTHTYVNRTFSGSAIGFFGAYDFYRKGGFSLGSGLDVNQSTVSVDVQAKNDAGTLDKSIFSIKSSLTVFSLYIPVRYEKSLFHSNFSLSLGGDLLIPLFASGSPNVTETDNVNGGKVTDTISDAQSALAHKKSTFGVGLFLGLTYSR